METGSIGKWMAKEGDKIDEGGIFCEIETDKATVDYEAVDECYLAKILLPEGSNDIPVGVPIMVTVENAADVAAFANYSVPSATASAEATTASAAPTQPVAQPEAAPAAPPAPAAGAGPRLSPAAAVWISRHGLDPAAIPVTGKSVTGDPFVTKGDVLAFMGGSATAASPSAPITIIPAVSTQQAAAPPAPAPAAAAKPSAAAPAGHHPRHSRRKWTDTPITTMRKVIASRLTESKFQVPHYYVAADCDITALLALRKDLIAATDRKVSVNDFVIRAVALALRDVPQANAQWDETTGTVVPQSTVDVSVAVATESGLITPIVRDANRKQLSEINTEVRDLAGLARIGRLKPEQFQGGTFTVSNLGMFGVDQFTSIINLPQACILAVSQSESRVVLKENADGVRVPTTASVMGIQLSADRRVVDEALAAQYVQVLQAYLSTPQLLLM